MAWLMFTPIRRSWLAVSKSVLPWRITTWPSSAIRRIYSLCVRPAWAALLTILAYSPSVHRTWGKRRVSFSASDLRGLAICKKSRSQFDFLRRGCAPGRDATGNLDFPAKIKRSEFLSYKNISCYSTSTLKVRHTIFLCNDPVLVVHIRPPMRSIDCILLMLLFALYFSLL